MTVAVPTLNRGTFLLDCLRDLAAQDHRPLEILVVDQSEARDRDLAAFCAEHAVLVSYHRVPFRGLPLARNYAWQHARHDAVLYVDDDIRCGPRLVSEHLRSLQLPRVGVVAGGIDEPNKPADRGPPTGRFNRWTGTCVRGFAAHGEEDVDHAPGGNFSTWVDVVRRAGGFDESLNVGAALYEELEFCLRVRRARYRIHFNGNARLTHLAAAKGGCRVEQIADYVRALAHNRGILIRRHVPKAAAPVALARLGVLCLSYAVHYRFPGALSRGLRGVADGLRQGKRMPRCSEYRVRTTDLSVGPLPMRL